MRLMLALLVWMLPSLAGAEPGTDLRQVDFWRQSAGWWLATCSYFDGDMNVRLREYHTLTLVDVHSDRVQETEYKFYPPGDASPYLSEGRISSEKGVELVTVSEHTSLGNDGAVRQISMHPAVVAADDMETHVLAADSAIRRVIDPASGYEHYRQYVSMNEPGRRYVINMGLVSDAAAKPALLGALRGFAVSRAERIESGQVESERTRLRALHSVGGIVSAQEDGSRHVQLLINQND